ncbi:lytic transglycosylase domain-containing protein [Phenylobacterium sp.]|uniref:lytic transglycosylase domain-containing protein n=1 Tax=Phenylobacterium sp. TaxID=1871053 RepID=UPI00271B596D|nr:lytic transglycosylase domain-containing protein [Phenylobacterium sp.]MDO8377896.1 lytic transglycosylase domain-containing protein [Phenylobacterium sp.]
MPSQARKAFLTAAAAVLLSGVAEAQQPPVNGPRPYEGPPPPIELTQTQPIAYRGSLSDTDGAALRSALESAKRADVTGARSAIAMINDPIAKKIATWALADSAADSLSFFEIDQARRDLAGWPRSGRRQMAAEKLLETSGQSPQRIIDWLGGAEPVTAEGAIALASAYRATGRSKEAASLIRHFWRDRLFEADPQRSMLARFGDVLTVDDHVRRADVILFGSQGPAARDMIPLLPADQAQLAQARMALRQNSPSANALVNALPASVSNSPGLAFERAAYMRRRGMDQIALGLVKSFPTDIPFTEMGERIWDERYQLVISALRNGDSLGAYTAAANTGLTQGTDATEAEFYAGWIALTRLKRPEDADRHFAAIEKIGSSPITRARALYWRGRAAQDRGQQDRAQGYYGGAARFNTTFYGQLAGEKIGYGKLTLGRDPIITQADRNRFEGRETVRAARLLYEIGNKDLFKTFVLTLDDILPTAEEEALLVDLARGYGDIDTGMKVVRAAAQRGFILPERGYPVRSAPDVPGAPEPALVLGITRQESGFDPTIRSGAGARGMMQLMPGTASVVARRMGASYSPGMLDDPEYNMRLGSSYLGQMVGTFSGSYPMAIAAYNAGPGRPIQWSTFCGDPRGAATDPIDFIECIPFSETRNYVMRVMEGMQVYRARLNGGTAPITLSADLKRGGYGTGYVPSGGIVQSQNAIPTQASGGMAPIPN